MEVPMVRSSKLSFEGVQHNIKSIHRKASALEHSSTGDEEKVA